MQIHSLTDLILYAIPLIPFLIIVVIWGVILYRTVSEIIRIRNAVHSSGTTATIADEGIEKRQLNRLYQRLAALIILALAAIVFGIYGYIQK